MVTPLCPPATFKRLPIPQYAVNNLDPSSRHRFNNRRGVFGFVPVSQPAKFVGFGLLISISMMVSSLPRDTRFIASWTQP